METQAQWYDVFQVLIFLLIGFLGAPLTQYLKNKMGVEDRAAVALTAGVSLLLALAEMVLSGVIGTQNFEVENLPATFFGVFGMASLYYGWLKGSDSVFGKGGLLKGPDKEPEG